MQVRCYVLLAQNEHFQVRSVFSSKVYYDFLAVLAQSWEASFREESDGSIWTRDSLGNGK